MEDITSWQIKNEIDISELERKLNEVFHELAQKKTSLEDLRSQLNAENAEKKEILIKFNSLNRDAVDTKIQLEAATKAFHTCEDNLNTTRATSIRQKQQLDAALKTNDKLQEQIGTLQSENVSLQNKIEVMERQFRSNTMVRDSFIVKLAKTRKVMDALAVQTGNLEKDSKYHERLCNVATELGNKNKLLIEHHNTTLKYNQEQKECLSQQVIRLSAENDILREQIKHGGQDTIQQPNDNAEYMADIMQEWQNSLNEMKVRAASEKKESEHLQLALKGAFESQVKLQNLETFASNRMKEAENILQHERQLHKKPQYVNISQQTEKVHVVEKGCGSEDILCRQSNIVIQTDFQLQTEKLGQCDKEIQTDFQTKTEPLERYDIEIQTDLLQPSIGLPSGFEIDSCNKPEDLEDISDWPTQMLHQKP